MRITMILAALAVCAAAAAAAAEVRAAPALTVAEVPPPSWLPVDPADSLWRAARQALDRGDNPGAAALYQRIRTDARFSASVYRPAAYYWEAFARHRVGSTTDLRYARGLLTELQRRHPDYADMASVEGLAARIDGQLATAGDRAAGERRATNAAQAAQCPDLELRTAAVEALTSMPPAQAMPVLRQVMARREQCDVKLREQAVFLIARANDQEAGELLLQAVRTDPSPRVREQAVFWLSRVDGDRAIDALADILRTSTDRGLVEHAVVALSQHRSPRAGALLRDVASQTAYSAEARKHAIFWLAQRKDPESATFLRSLYPSLPSSELKEAVLVAVAQQATDDNVNWLMSVVRNEREPAQIREQALFWAGRQRAVPLATLGELYMSLPGRGMKEQVIYTISQRSEPEALDRLIDIARREQNVELRRTALFWIGKSKDPRAVRFLAEIIGG